MQAFVDRATIYAYEGNGDLATADLDMALGIKPDDVTALIERCAIYAAQRDYQHALTDLNAAVKADPKNLGAILNRAAAYHGLGDNGKAIADLDTVIKERPDLAGASYNRGNTYRALGEYDNAFADYDTLIYLTSPRSTISRAASRSIPTRQPDPVAASGAHPHASIRQRRIRRECEADRRAGLARACRRVPRAKDLGAEAPRARGLAMRAAAPTASAMPISSSAKTRSTCASCARRGNSSSRRGGPACRARPLMPGRSPSSGAAKRLGPSGPAAVKREGAVRRRIFAA